MGINCTNVSFGQSPKVIEIKAKINSERGTINNMRGQPPDWDKIFANDVAKDSKEDTQMAKALTYEKLTLAYEKLLNITNYYGNANQNCSVVSPHTGRNGHQQKVYK